MSEHPAVPVMNATEPFLRALFASGTIRIVTIPAGPKSPWNTAFWLRYVHNHAKRAMFRYRHGPALDGPNTFETVEFS